MKIEILTKRTVKNLVKESLAEVLTNLEYLKDRVGRLDEEVRVLNARRS